MLVVVFGISRLLRRTGVNYAYILAITILILGFVFSPFLGAVSPECSSDVIAANEVVGAYLARNIPPGSQVYWAGGKSAAPLLYLPHIKIYPAQINDGSALRIGGDPQQLLKYGFYNVQNDKQWLNEANFVIVEARYYEGMKNRLSPNNFDKLPPSPIPTSCSYGSGLLIFRRK